MHKNIFFLSNLIPKSFFIGSSLALFFISHQTPHHPHAPSNNRPNFVQTLDVVFWEEQQKYQYMHDLSTLFMWINFEEVIIVFVNGSIPVANINSVLLSGWSDTFSKKIQAILI